MKYKFYMFDMDLTLLDTIDSSIISYTHCFKKAGAIFDKKNVYLYAAETLPETLARIDNPKCSIQDFIKAFEASASETFNELAKFYDDGLALLKYLKSNGCKLGIVTNRPRNTIIDILKKENLEDYFDSIVTSSDINIYKPNPDPILKCMANINMKKEDSVYIGDAYNDYLAATRAGIDFFSIERYNQCNYECENRIHNLEELIED